MFNVRSLSTKGFSYATYRNRLNDKIRYTNKLTMSAEAAEKFEFSRLNVVRMDRLDRTYIPSPEMTAAIESVKSRQIWLLITAGWCGDSAQNIPAIVKLAEINPLIDLYIVERDEQPEIMDQFLTDGKRSIPILAAFDEDGNELFRWGSRPKSAQELVTNLKNSGAAKKEWEERLHLWYARNRNSELESELMEKLQITA